ncbi:hypothetical protein [Streptomyces coelicoflavus]|uniref:hypothetical protein n=1 Tax=Streptomyces coelicoflavus TaxID=285562 RepID=UPI0036BB1335
MTMRHPDLPEQPIEVDDVSVPTYQASGWELDDNPPPTLTKARPARRRRQTGDEN